jgi:isocitrate lyase
VPAVGKRINNARLRSDQIQWMQGVGPGDPADGDDVLPIKADAEAGFEACSTLSNK